MANSPYNGLFVLRRKILENAGNEVYPQSGEFFDSISSIRQIDLKLKKRIENLNLPTEFESIKNREEYKNKVLYHFIKSEWKRINDVLKERIPDRPDGIPNELLISELIYF
jgi:hypothetical protein